jgi:hypothetical protein
VLWTRDLGLRVIIQEIDHPASGDRETSSSGCHPRLA